MHSIYICDDNSIQLLDITDIIKDYVLFHNHAYKMGGFSPDPADLFNQIQADQVRLGVYFLDIELGNLDTNGIDLATAIRQIDPFGKIIFITSHTKYAPMVLKRKVEPFALVEKGDKEVMRQEIFQCLNLITDQENSVSNQEDPMISFKIGNKVYRFLIDEVIYIQISSLPHRLELVTETGHYQFYGKIKAYQREYPQDLFGISRSTLINPDKIRLVDGDKRLLTLDNGDQLPFSASKKVALEKFVLAKHKT
ncbi:hypothetical protein AWM75_04365 [Aerococcus urinaehominis]|uniref:Uncharacterized protein n=1 Tax=Aerococcus urinaehominis TaxID=128944 RepID=A0A109RHR5_9LACT|nr:LytTR family DNA-binding domain-containing protein [Aerococcus urinaehominis]AMB99281.1 hypothetical protein AWM75_04365 [Aerococcus urinaehominis]SDM47756.1 two component transcriptional regulator, LytTR family [Aerococcus urinaehominis]